MKKVFIVNFLICLFSFLLFNSSLDFEKSANKNRPRNIIIFIGDGMGLASISYLISIEKQSLNIEKFKHIGFSKTYSASNYITDSGAGGTAIATGQKTYNSAVGVNKDTIPVKNLIEIAKEKGLTTGIVVTSSVTYATPASFVAHIKNRNLDNEIAYSYLNNTVDIFIGGGNKYFNKSIKDSLIKLGYQIVYDTNSLKVAQNTKIAALLAENHLPRAKNRGNMLSLSVKKAIDLLSKNMEGFFLMVEGSQIDWAAHLNDKNYLVDEIKDFDNAIGVALDFAMKNENTLIIVTADHETGGIILSENKRDKKLPDLKFCSKNHTGVMVPVFAYGTNAEFFTGIYENTDIFYKIKKLMNYE